MVTELEKELIQIGQKITDGTCSYGELAFLQDHKQEVLDMGDITLCEQAGITEEEYNNGKLNPDLFYKGNFITLGIDTDKDGNAHCKIAVEDGEHLVLTECELTELIRILTDNKEEIQEYFHQIYEKFKDLY